MMEHRSVFQRQQKNQDNALVCQVHSNVYIQGFQEDAFNQGQGIYHIRKQEQTRKKNDLVSISPIDIDHFDLIELQLS